jgi:divalent metal cation (Fe/Co/Zn/Cd) transporter
LPLSEAPALPGFRLPVANPRPQQVSAALRLEYWTISWNVAEGVLALVAAGLAGSIALLGFGVDSVIEVASGGILVWRLWSERRNADLEHVEAIEHRAQRLVAVSLALLAVYVAADAGTALWRRQTPAASPIGIGVTCAALVVMLVLARAKRQAGRRLNSRALLADAGQTQACFYLSAVVLVGLALNAALHWWWADPLAALAIIPFLGLEARDAWQGRDCC